MLFKFLHIIGLFAYLNIIVYEAGFNALSKDTVLDGHSLVEYVIDDLLDLPKTNVQDLKIPNEEYRLAKASMPTIGAIAFFLCFFLYRQVLRTQVVEHPSYKARSLCLPGYYSFLFRLKPF
jgi:hypothetical protein